MMGGNIQSKNHYFEWIFFSFEEKPKNSIISTYWVIADFIILIIIFHYDDKNCTFKPYGRLCRPVRV